VTRTRPEAPGSALHLAIVVVAAACTPTEQPDPTPPLQNDDDVQDDDDAVDDDDAGDDDDAVDDDDAGDDDDAEPPGLCEGSLIAGALHFLLTWPMVYQETLAGPVTGTFTEQDGFSATFQPDQGEPLYFSYQVAGDGGAGVPDLTTLGPVEVWWSSHENTIDLYTTIILDGVSGELILQAGTDPIAAVPPGAWAMQVGESECPQIDQGPWYCCWDWIQRRPLVFSRGLSEARVYEGREAFVDGYRIAVTEASFSGGEFHGDICIRDQVSYFITPQP